MIEWTLGILFTLSAALLVVSIIKTHKTAQAEEERIDLAHISLIKEIKDLQDKVKKLELDLEIITRESGLELSPHEIIFRREIIDLYKRGYSIENIAKQKDVSVEKIHELLAPYRDDHKERSATSHAN